MTPAGYAGSILRIDLSTGSVSETSTYKYTERFCGGRGLAARIYWEEVPPETGAFDEENRLICALGPLAGVPALGGSRWGIFSKSPIHSPETFNYGNLGGTWGADLKFAGYDALIIQGKSEKPVYISITDGRVEIHNAHHLWGKGSLDTREIIKSDLGKKYRVMAIGPAGENRVVNAVIIADGDASCSGGMGAVMGAKNLKAVCVRGTNRRVDTARPDELQDIAHYIRGLGRGNTQVWGLDFMAQGPKTKMAPCYGCMAHCLRVNYTADDGTTGKFMCQSRFFYFLQSLIYHQADTDVPFLANKLCDQYGLDTWTLQQIMEWLLRCHKEGIISEDDSGIPFSRVGSFEFIETLVEMISLRKGIGEILALGLEPAARSLGAKAEALVHYSDPYEPRLYNINTLLFPFEPREPIQQIHEAGLTLAQWVTWAKGVDGAHISTKVLKGIAEKFWGGESAADLSTFDGKARAAKLIQDRQYAKESLMVCDWMYPVIDIPSGENHVGDPSLESRIFSAVTGLESDTVSLSELGERVFNLQRAILLREGHRAGEDDILPMEWHTEPLEGHVADPDCLVPGKNGEKISRKGARIDMAEFIKMRAEYYSLRGWNRDTGLQTEEGLKRMGLSDICDIMKKDGLLHGEDAEALKPPVDHS